MQLDALRLVELLVLLDTLLVVLLVALLEVPVFRQELVRLVVLFCVLRLSICHFTS